MKRSAPRDDTDSGNKTPLTAADASLSKKAKKKLADAHFEERFAPPPDEPVWDETHHEEDFWAKVGCEEPKNKHATPSVAAERARRDGVSRVRKNLSRLCGDRYPSMAFERWHLACDEGDPVFPRGGDECLKADLVASKHSAAEADAIVAEHARAVAAARGRAAATASTAQATTATRRDGAVTFFFCGDATVELPEKVDAKLRELARRAGTNADDVDACILAMTMRYDALGGSGFQAALPGAAFRALRAKFGVNFECFASPLNAYYERYCSAHADVDAPFGSLGSFYDFSPRRGAFECNPPFAPAPLLRAARRCDALLAAAEARRDALAFAFVAPVWTDQAAWAAVDGSRFKRGAVRVPREDHAWRDARTARARRVPVDTAIFILATSAAEAAHPCDAAALGEVRAALLVP